MSDTNKPALPEPAAETVMDLFQDHEGPVAALECLPIGTKLYTADQLRTAIAAAVAEVNALNGALTDKCNGYIIANARLAEQVAEARAVPEDMLRYLRDVLQDGTPNERDIARTVMSLIAAAPSPAEQPKPAVREEALFDAIKDVLLHHRMSYTEGEDAEAFPLVDMLCPPGSRDISKGHDEITLICDAIYNDEAVRAALSGEQP